MSALAVTAFALAVIPLCLPLNAVGVVLGLMATRRIVASQGRLGGLRLARSSVVIGLGLTILAMVLLSRTSTLMAREDDEAKAATVTAFIEAAVDGDGEAARALWDPAMTLDDDQLLAFGQETRERFGALHAVSITTTRQTGGILTPEVEFAVVLDFDDGMRVGAAAAKMLIGPLRGWIIPVRSWTFKLQYLSIDDGAGGIVEIGSLPDAVDRSAGQSDS